MRDQTEKLKRIRESCDLCGGTGLAARSLETGVKLDDCACVKRVGREIALIKANIQERYRDFDLRNITRDFEKNNKTSLQAIKDYGERITENVRSGKSLWMHSGPGLGKSSLISWILKRAIDAGHVAYCIRASHLLKTKLEGLKNPESKELVDYLIDTVDILAIEEIEKVYLTGHEDFIPALFFEFLSDVYDSKKAILLSSNLPIDEVIISLPLYIQDRLSAVQGIRFVGKSERVNIESFS